MLPNSGDEEALIQSNSDSHLSSSKTYGLTIWLYLHWLSLDVMLGAMVSATWIGRNWGSEPNFWTLVATGCGALWIYSVDHWADAQRLDSHATLLVSFSQCSPRRAFYSKLKYLLVMLAFLSAFIGGWASLHLPMSTFKVGLVCLGICSVYLWTVQKISRYQHRYPKELIITILYSLALSLWPLSMWIDSYQHSVSFRSALESNLLRGILLTTEIACLAWSNLCLISAHERKADLLEHMNSLATLNGEDRTRQLGYQILKFAIFLLSFRLIIACYLIFTSHQVQITYHLQMLMDSVIELFMIGTLMLLYHDSKWSDEASRYRRWADIIFIYPLLSLLLF